MLELALLKWKKLLKDVHLHSVEHLHNIVVQRRKLDSEALKTSNSPNTLIPLPAAAPWGADSSTCACAHVDECVPWNAAASTQLLSWGVGGDDWVIQALP